MIHFLSPQSRYDRNFCCELMTFPAAPNLPRNHGISKAFALGLRLPPDFDVYGCSTAAYCSVLFSMACPSESFLEKFHIS